MKATDRKVLTQALQGHVGKIAADLRGKLRGQAPGSQAVRERALRLHADEKVAEDFEVWTDLLSRRGAVLWVLKSVYVRVLEDRGLLSPGRLLDGEAQELFEKLAPHLGEAAFLRWIYKDLASPRGGVPELFGLQPAELALPSDELSRALIAFWRHRDADSGASWSFAEEHFEGELMGDLYQELDPVVKQRFALCQTPDFVRAFILDRTLTPAIEEFGAEKVRLLDPACGSGHFLIDGLKRLVAATAEQHPDWPRLQLVRHALGRVVGIDLNDYACALARTRLVMTAAELAGVGTLAEAAQFHPHVYWADGLEQVEREEQKSVVQLGLFAPPAEEKPRAVLTRSDVRAALKKVFENKFHAVVANPPYIVESDDARKAYHREKINGRQRYISAYRQYSLGCPFTERCFQLAEKEGFVGIITSNNFMKREFGKPLIEKVLSQLDLTLVVDTSQAYIPFHGTPTVLLFGRNRRPSSDSVRAVMGKRGESGTPSNPAQGRVWTSILHGWNEAVFESEYVSVASVPRSTLQKHPWSLGGGGAAELKELIAARGTRNLGQLSAEIGRTTHTGLDEVFLVPEAFARRICAEARWVFLMTGDVLRDWAGIPAEACLLPYDSELRPSQAEATLEVAHYRRYQVLLRSRLDYGQTMEERGKQWFEHSMFFANRFRAHLAVGFAFVATHNHFVLDRGGKVFNRSAPVIKLPAGSTEEDHLALLGLLNSSTACFWMKQVFHNKGLRGQGGGITATDWEQFSEFDATKMKLFPVAPEAAQAIPYAQKLDALATSRTAGTVAEELSKLQAGASAQELQQLLLDRRERDFANYLEMVALQEELDWLCYSLYGIDTESDVVAPDEVESLPPTWLPWCLDFACRDEENRAAIARGEETTDLPTVWFERHRWTPLTELPAEASPKLRARIEARRARTRENPALALIETANYKRRWYQPDYEKEEQEALKLWLADRAEEVAKERGRTLTLGQLSAALQDDQRVLAVCEVLTGGANFNLAELFDQTLLAESVPNHPLHLYKPGGLIKRAAWERTWEDQRREDAGEAVEPEVPPAYGSGDFLKSEYWQLRGKLDVPKERFIAFTEVPGRSAEATLYGWAGWTPMERLRAILTIDEELDDTGVPLANRIALLDSAWRLLPDAAREDPAVASRLKAELQVLVGLEGPSKELLEDWSRRFPPPTRGKARKKRSKASIDDEAEIG